MDQCFEDENLLEDLHLGVVLLHVDFVDALDGDENKAEQEKKEVVEDVKGVSDELFNPFHEDHELLPISKIRADSLKLVSELGPNLGMRVQK